MTQSAVPIKKQINLLLDEDGYPVTKAASIGIIYKINKMPDPVITVFGEDTPEQALPLVTQQSGSMVHILH